MKLRSSRRCFGGLQRFYTHDSSSCQSPMNFGIFLPSKAAVEPCPVIYFLSGLTCTDENFMAKSGAQRVAEELGLILVAPDTSPRGRGFAGERDDWAFGEGASFYVNATEAPWSSAYRMYDYVAYELPDVIDKQFNTLPHRRGIMGHSMGGHGAMVIGLREPERFTSVSAFSPICAPTKCPWGKNAFSKFLGADETKWANYDVSWLIANGAAPKPIRVDQGADDEFLHTQLLTDELVRAANAIDFPIEIHMHDGYDHSYYFVATFIEAQLQHHANALCVGQRAMVDNR